jgi:crotonobetainyl-CoA:carnitine CoA-transferase CaiB-like acyl-CoA transferase
VNGASRTGTHRADLLEGLRVLEVGDGVAGSSAASVLWALGAEVTAVVDPTSTHRRGAPSVERDGGRVSLQATILDRGKRLVSLAGSDELEALLASEPFNVVVVDRVHGARGPLSSLHDVEAYAAFVEANNRGGWVTISAFGLTGERGADTATELTIAAAGGMLASSRDPRTGQPLKLAGQQSLLNTGQVAALAACHAVDLAHDGPVHLDLAAVEAAIATGPVLELATHLLNTGGGGGAKRYGAPAGFYECLDGRIRISAMEDHQWQGVVAAMGSPSWADQYATVDSRIEASDAVDQRVIDWTRTKTKGEAETVLQGHGVPATAVYSPAELLHSPQLAHREAFEPFPVGDGREATIVGDPVCVVDGGNADAGRARRKRSLRGLRMLEASHVLAAPLSGAVLGALGVEVTKLEDVRRMDMYRRRGPYVDAEAGMERSAYFVMVNHSKRGVAFDLDAHRDRLAALLDQTDVVIENLGGKRAQLLGVAASSVGAEHPDVLAVSSTGFGQDGPYARYRAYAYNLHASAALGYLSRAVDGEPADLDMAWADLISGFTLATIVAAWAVGPSGNRGAGVDFAMADLVISHFNEFLAAASLDPDSDESVDRANELTPYAPHGVYPTADGWVAVAVDGDEQYTALAKVLGAEALRDEAFATAEGRWAQRQALDAQLADATRGRLAADLAADLRAAAVSAEAVLPVAALIDVPQLVERQFFTSVEHPVCGPRRVVGIPWRPYGGPPIPLGPPPQFQPLDDDETADPA